MKPRSRSSASLRGRVIRPLILSWSSWRELRLQISRVLRGPGSAPVAAQLCFFCSGRPASRGPVLPTLPGPTISDKVGRLLRSVQRASPVLLLPVSLRFKSDTGGRRLLPGALCRLDDHPSGLRNGQISRSVVGASGAQTKCPLRPPS
ncbi:hypothetical protein NDU88_002602 [Pleurodeles waltl]|uniref:Uncharacterized protein n=1 Tax=Pleurodeles waltl TaxID=8319 RepID=A0AAV7TLN4_PLEWA|nr:hypothetical protein NDU88_002602 [Pleurodeles waltl]